MTGRRGARHHRALTDRERSIILNRSLSREAVAERLGYSISFIDRLRREDRDGS